MSTLADMAIDLLCTLTFQPEGGYGPEDLASIEQGWWQALIHELSSEERQKAEAAIKKQMDAIHAQKGKAIPEHITAKAEMLEAFLRGELR